MKKFEVKKVDVMSSFKATLYMMVIPAALSILIGLLIVVVGIVSEKTEFIAMGAVATIVYPLMFLGLYGVFAMLAALVYNAFAGKFGGLKLTLEEENIVRYDNSYNQPPKEDFGRTVPNNTPDLRKTNEQVEENKEQ